MGTDGMSFSLQSRDLIADSIETVMGAQWWLPAPPVPTASHNTPQWQTQRVATEKQVWSQRGDTEVTKSYKPPS